MAIRLGLGPVFYFEWLTSSRRWQMYAGRSLFVAMLLAALSIVWYAETQDHPVFGATASRKLLAEMGEKFFYAVIGTQLTLVLLIAPALTAGAVCIDKARGTLLHLLATDLANHEIVLGKLAMRLLTLFGLVCCTLPVLFICTLEGGIDPEALFGAFLITLGIAIFGGALGLMLSVWCSKVYEVLLASYMIIFLLLMVNLLLRFFGLKVTPPFCVEALNVYWLAFAPYWSPGAVSAGDDLWFLGGCTGIAVVFMVFAVWRVRAVAIHQSSKLVRPRRPLLAFIYYLRPAHWLPGFGVDFNPVLWREWHRKRPSIWVLGVWTLYVLLAVFFTGAVIYEYSFQGGSRRALGPFVNAFQVALGLLLVCVASVTALSEERVRGTMDLLLTTTIPTWKIVWGKWCGVYRTVILLSILPGAIILVMVWREEFWLGVRLMVGLVLAWGAAVTSFGLALATWNRRPGRALAYSVIVYVGVTVGWFVIVMLMVRGTGGGRTAQGMAIASPWFGSGMFTAEMEERHHNYNRGFPDQWSIAAWSIFWIVVYTGAAVVFFLLALFSFNRCLGRMPFYPSQVDDLLRPNLHSEARARAVARQSARPR